MHIDISPRSFGKTTRLIEWLKKDSKRILVTFSNQEAARLKELYPELKEQIYEWSNWRDNQFCFEYEKEIGIDNADLILQSLLRNEIKILTITQEEKTK